MKQILVMIAATVFVGCGGAPAIVTVRDSNSTKPLTMKEKAEAGDPQAQYNVGFEYEHGEKTEKDLKEALESMGQMVLKVLQEQLDQLDLKEEQDQQDQQELLVLREQLVLLDLQELLVQLDLLL